MPKCSVVGCGSRKTKNQKRLSLHRLPKSKYIRKKWLDAIGTENISPNVKDIFICSLHFHESAFNTTLDVIRLRDGAIPFQSHGEPSTGQGESDLQKEIKQEKNISENTPLAEKVINLLPVESTATVIMAQPVPSTSRASLISLEEQTHIKKLEQKCGSLKRKIRTLNEKVRRQKKKIANYKNIIKDLQKRNLMNNESSIILEACAGPKDFLKRQISKSEGLPLERQYSEETRKFALTLHFFFLLRHMISFVVHTTRVSLT